MVAVRLPKPKTCRICKTRYQPEPGLRPRVCSVPCAIKLAQQQRKVAAERREREARRERREKLKDLKPLSKVCAEVQRDVNRYVRLRDAKYGTCICGCGRGIDDAGHFFGVGSKWRTSRLRFETDAIHGCCAKCNRFVGGGNVVAFEAGLRARYGDEYVERLYEMKRRYELGEVPPLTKAEAWQIAADARRKCRELRKARGE